MTELAITFDQWHCKVLNMPIGLIRLISTQKVLKICINKGVKEHYLGSNQLGSLKGYPRLHR